MEKESGVYKIEHISSRKVYIGSSKNMYRRCHRHMSELRHGKHNNQFLQRAFIKYGKNDFKVESLEKCTKEILEEREQFYIDKYKSFNEKYGFNLLKKAYSPKGRIVTEKTKEKLRKIGNSKEQKEIRKKRTTLLWKNPEYRNFQILERKSRYKNEEFVNKRKKIYSTPEYKKKRSEICKSIWKNAKSRDSLINERKERWKDPEYRKRLSESAKKKWNNPEYRENQCKKFSIGQKKRSKDPEYIKQCSERAKAQWAERKKWFSTSSHDK